LLFERGLELRLEDGAVTNDRLNLRSLCHDRPPPGRRPPVRLKLPLQQVHQEHLHPAVQLAKVALPHVLDLLCHVRDVDVRETAGS